MPTSSYRPQRTGERGMALIVAIGFLLVLSILGAVVLTVANRGLEESAKISPVKRSFYVVDRAIEYAMNGDLVYNLSASTAPTVNLVTGVAKDRNSVVILDTSGQPLVHKKVIESTAGGSAAGGTLVSGQVTDLGAQALPASLAGKYTTDFGANMYHVSAEGRASGGETQRVDASIVRLYKLEDDVIFRTTGGG